jgi:ubiquinone/menaquinone biosynthesis C-methylase UbiE
MTTSETLAGAGPLVADETAFLGSLVPLEGARVIELGCGKGDFARKLVQTTPVAAVTAYEVDKIQHRKNLETPAPAKLAFAFGGAERIDLPDASVDGVVMMKSLHHVPMESLDAALAEIARVLKPGGWFYASEPLFAGELNEIVRLFHDEEKVRAAAHAALKRAAGRKLLHEEREIFFSIPVRYDSFEQFEQNTIRATHTHHDLSPEIFARVREAFMAHMRAGGARFVRPMRANLMRKEAA